MNRQKETPRIRSSAGATMTMSMSAYLRKYSLISLVGIVIAIIQSTLFGIIPFFGVTPDMIFMFALSIAFLDGWIPGCIAAIAGGALSDVLGADGATAMILLYFATVVATVLVTDGRLAKNFPSFAITCVSACMLKAIYEVFYISTTSLDYSVIDLFGKTIVPEFAATAVCAIPIYFVTKKIINSF